MTIVKVKGQQTTARQGVSEGGDVFLRGLRDGSLITADWRSAAVMGGFGFTTIGGGFSTGKVGGGAGTTMDINTPEFLLSIPNGTCVMPLVIGVQVQMGAPADAQEQEILVAIDQDIEWNKVGASTHADIYNLNTLSARASACTARNAITTTITATPTTDIELARVVAEYSVSSGGESAQILDLCYEPKTMVVINGPAMILVYHGGDAANIGGFVQLQWLEFPEGTFSV